MDASTVGSVDRLGLETVTADPFDLDIRIAEIGEGMPVAIANVTDDNCSSTCPTACVSEAGVAEDC